MAQSTNDSKRVQYSKQKMIYSLRSDDGVCDMLFPNFKAGLTWFASQSLFPFDISKEYDRILRAVRSGKKHVILVGNVAYSFKQIPLFGVSVQSSKRAVADQVVVSERVKRSVKISKAADSVLSPEQIQSKWTADFISFLSLDSDRDCIHSAGNSHCYLNRDSNKWMVYSLGSFHMYFSSEREAIAKLYHCALDAGHKEFIPSYISLIMSKMASRS